MAIKRIPKFLILIFGFFGVLGSFGGFLTYENAAINLLRIYGTCFLYFTLVFILTRNFIEANAITLRVVIGAMSGYLLIGFLGASTIEMMDYFYPGSFKMESSTSYDYYYFSFISLVTVGYGDIVPLTYAAKSLTVLISVTGQFYITLGLASLVSKFLSK